MGMQLSDLVGRVKSNSLYGTAYFSPKHVHRHSEKVKAQNEKFLAAAAACRGTKGIAGNRTKFQKCVGEKL